MTAWQIYWVMQLDSIGVTLFVFGLIGIVAGGGAAIPLTVAVLEGEEDAKPWQKFAFRVLAAGFFCALLNTFLPSTKTAAAMIVLPAIANSETLRKEAGELYGLAKEALRDAIDAPEPKEQSK